MLKPKGGHPKSRLGAAARSGSSKLTLALRAGTALAVETLGWWCAGVCSSNGFLGMICFYGLARVVVFFRIQGLAGSRRIPAQGAPAFCRASGLSSC